MGEIRNNITELIGKTPMMALENYGRGSGIEGVTLLAKLEYLNPTGSVKDRAAFQMILDAEADGKLKTGATIIEPTSGNTGIGLAAIAAARGYRVILTLPETMSVERRKLLAAYGAEIVLTPGREGMKGAIAKAEELHTQIPGSFIPGQFDNPSNAKAHRKSGYFRGGSGFRRNHYRRRKLAEGKEAFGTGGRGGTGILRRPFRKRGGGARTAGNRRGFCSRRAGYGSL